MPESATAPTLKPCCHIRLKLADEFATSARLFAEAVAEMTGNATDSDFEYLRTVAHAAHERAEKASAMFEEHISSHACSTGRF